MKVLILTTYGAKEGHGGQARVAWELAEALSDYCHTAIMSPGNEYKIKEISDNFSHIYFKGTDIKDVETVPSFSYRSIKKLFRCLDKLNPDIIHIHDPGLLALFVQIWGIKNNKLLFYTSHLLPTKFFDFGDSEAVSNLVRKILNIPVKPYLKAVYFNTDVMIALNKYAKQDIKDFGYEGTFEVIPNGRNLDRLYSCPLTSFKTDRKILTFIGFLCERKNQKFLIRVMKYLPEDYELRLVGRGMSSDYRGKMEDLAEKLGVQSQIKFYGAVPYKEIPKVLSDTHFFVSASLMEVQSLAIIESLASGTPVIGLENETTSELVDSKVGRLLSAEISPEEFAKEVKKLFGLRKRKYERMSKRCRKRVEHMDRDKVVKKTFETYQKYYSRKRELRDNKSNRLDKALALLPTSKLRSFLNKEEKLEVSNNKSKKTRIPLKVVILSFILLVAGVVIFLLFGSTDDIFKKIKEKFKSLYRKDE